MHRKQWHLHCERNGKRNEQPAALGNRERTGLGQDHKIERDFANRVTRQQRRCHNAHQHECRPGHGEQKELGGRIHAVVITPTADQEIHRHEHNFEKHEEQKQVEAHERAHHACLQDEHPRQIRALVMVRVDPGDYQWKQNSGEHHEKQRNAVNAEMPRNTPGWNPLVL